MVPGCVPEFSCAQESSLTARNQPFCAVDFAADLLQTKQTDKMSLELQKIVVFNSAALNSRDSPHAARDILGDDWESFWLTGTLVARGRGRNWKVELPDGEQIEVGSKWLRLIGSETNAECAQLLTRREGDLDLGSAEELDENEHDGEYSDENASRKHSAEQDTWKECVIHEDARLAKGYPDLATSGYMKNLDPSLKNALSQDDLS